MGTKTLSEGEKKLAERLLAYRLILGESGPKISELLKEAVVLAEGANVEGMKNYIGELYKKGKEAGGRWHIDTTANFHLDWLEGVQVRINLNGCYPVDENGKKV